MRRLTRHVATHVGGAVLLVLAALLGLFAVAEFADELSDAGDHVSALQLIHYVLLRVPGFAVANTGFAMLIGCLMGLGVLASQSELAVMRASGVSVLRIVWMVLRPMLSLMLVMTLLGEYLIPDLERQAGKVLAEKQAADTTTPSLIDGGQGLWLRQGNDFLHLGHVLRDGTDRGQVDRVPHGVAPFRACHSWHAQHRPRSP